MGTCAFPTQMPSPQFKKMDHVHPAGVPMATIVLQTKLTPKMSSLKMAHALRVTALMAIIAFRTDAEVKFECQGPYPRGYYGLAL